jgi:tetratricopeptide (TPR) repeat protein/phage head maturation protease
LPHTHITHDVPRAHATKAQAISPEDGRIGGYLVVWGDTLQTDLQGQYFTPRTDFALHWYERRPMLYQHGLDGALKTSLIGTIEHLQADDFGIWAEAQLDMHQHYAQAVLALVEQGALHWSSGSIAHLVQVADDGHITRWPLIEGSLTPTPAEPRLTDVRTLVPQDDGALTYANALKSAYETLGIRADWMPPQHPRNLSQTLSQGDAMPTNPTPTIPARDDAPEMPQAPQQMPLPFGNTAQAYPSNIKRLPVNDGRARISVASEYDHLTADDMLHGYMLMRSSRRFAGEAILLDPEYVNAYFNRGVVMGILGDFEGALTNYDEVISLNPTLATAYNNRGYTKRELGDYGGALADFDEAIFLDPEYADAYHNRGILMLIFGDYEGALADVNEAILFNATFAEAYHTRGIVKGNLGDLDGARADFDEAILLNDTFADAYYTRGLMRIDFYDYEGALADFDEAIRSNPEFAPAYYTRGTLKGNLGDLQGAVDDFDQVIRLDPENVLAYHNRAITKHLLDDLQGALADFQQAEAMGFVFSPQVENIIAEIEAQLDD